MVLLVASVTTIRQQPASAQGDPSACPDPGQCTCNPATGVMTDHAMSTPFNRIICNGYTEQGPF
jgi:uncharacterized Zn-binding protein involved in type VI secretion